MPRDDNKSKKEHETKPVCEVKPEKSKEPAKEWPWSTSREVKNDVYDKSFTSEAGWDQDDQVESMDISLNSTLKGKNICQEN